jgi:hypothetical protein
MRVISVRNGVSAAELIADDAPAGQHQPGVRAIRRAHNLYCLADAGADECLFSTTLDEPNRGDRGSSPAPRVVLRRSPCKRQTRRTRPYLQNVVLQSSADDRGARLPWRGTRKAFPNGGLQPFERMTSRHTCRRVKFPLYYDILIVKQSVNPSRKRDADEASN